VRIALVVFGDLTDRSGGFRYDYHLRRVLESRGHTVRVVSQPDGVEYRRQPRLAREGWVDAVAGGGAAEPDAPPASRPDLVLIDELNHAATLGGIPDLRRRLPGVPIVAIVHHLRCDEERGRGALRFGPGLGTRIREGRFLRACDAWVCNSSVTLRRARRVSGVMRSSAVVFPAAQEGDRPRAPIAGEGASAPVQRRPAGTEHASPDRPVRIVTVGNVIPRKNLHLLIPAVLRTRGTVLDIYGDDSSDPVYTARLRELVREGSERTARTGPFHDGVVEGGDRRIRFHGRVSQEALNRALAGADLFAMPSSYEGFGIVYLEALGAGVPVLATARGGASEIVTNSGVGTLVQPTPRGIRRGLQEAVRRFRRDGVPVVQGKSDHDPPGGTAPRSDHRVEEACRSRAAAFDGWTRTMEGAAAFLEEIGTC